MQTELKTLNAQLEALQKTLENIPESDMDGNAAHYLKSLVGVVLHRGADEPMVGRFWHTEDFDGLLMDDDADAEGYTPINRDYARKLFALVDRTHNAEIGINWDVLRCALEYAPDEV